MEEFLQTWAGAESWQPWWDVVFVLMVGTIGTALVLWLSAMRRNR